MLPLCSMLMTQWHQFDKITKETCLLHLGQRTLPSTEELWSLLQQTQLHLHRMVVNTPRHPLDWSLSLPFQYACLLSEELSVKHLWVSCH